MNYSNTSRRNFLTSTLLAGFMVGPEAASGRKNRILVLGASGLTGGVIASTLDREPADIEVVRAARKKEQVEAWKREGKQAVYLDLDDARTFPAALEGIDRLFLLTGYTIAMLHQSKTLVDAAADSGCEFHRPSRHFWKRSVDRSTLCMARDGGALHRRQRRRMGALASAFLYAEYPHYPGASERPIALAYGR